MEDILTKMYKDIKLIKKGLDKIKIALIPEDEPTKEESDDIKIGNKEIADGKFREWKDIKTSEIFILSISTREKAYKK